MQEVVFENWLDLKTIYNKLKGQYALELSTGVTLNAGFDWDMEVLTGKSTLGRFYLYFNGIDVILDYDTESGMLASHWHPSDNDQALNYVVRFMEGTLP